MDILKRFLVIAAICASQASFAEEGAQIAPAAEPNSNRKAVSRVFTRPNNEGNALLQSALGLGEGLLAIELKEGWKHVGPRGAEAEVHQAREGLKKAKNSLTSAEVTKHLEAEIDRDMALQRAAEDLRSEATYSKRSGPIKLEMRVQEIGKRRLPPGVTKEQYIQAAERRLAAAEAVLKARPGFRKFFDRISKIKVLGSLLLVTDLAGRIYVWHRLDADPTITPLGAYLAKFGKGAISNLQLFDPNAIVKPSPAATEGETSPQAKQETTREERPFPGESASAAGAGSPQSASAN